MYAIINFPISPLKNCSLLKEQFETICIALPIQVKGLGQVDHIAKDLAEFVKGLGYKTIESQLIYIYNSLTREIMVNEKT